MRVLRARPDADRITRKTARDFNWAEPGEILTFGSVCEGDGGSHAARCGCDRAFVGLHTAKATTFGIVDEVDEIALAGIVRECKFVDGWSFGDNRDEIVESVMADLGIIADTLSDVEVGAEARVKLGATSVRMSHHDARAAGGSVSAAAITAAVQHIQTLRNQHDHEYLAWYVDRFTDEDPRGKTTERLREIMVADDWGERWARGSSEDEATSEAYEAEIQTLDRVLDVVQILARGGTPAQGSRTEIAVECDEDELADAAPVAALGRVSEGVDVSRITECGPGYVEVETTDGQCFGVTASRRGESKPGDVVYTEGASAILGDVCDDAGGAVDLDHGSTRVPSGDSTTIRSVESSSVTVARHATVTRKLSSTRQTSA